MEQNGTTDGILSSGAGEELTFLTLTGNGGEISIKAYDLQLIAA